MTYHPMRRLILPLLLMGFSSTIGGYTVSAAPHVGDVSGTADSSAPEASQPSRHGGMAVETDPAVLSVIREGSSQFVQHTYTDPGTGISLSYNLYIPTDYLPGRTYPLVMYIPDATAAGKNTAEIPRQYYGADVWVTKSAQERHPAIVVVPAYPTVAVDDNWNTSGEVGITMNMLRQIIREYPVDTHRIYTTGQSMGCMISLYLMSNHPDFFAAGLFVSGQWDPSVLQPLENQNFLYITAGGDEKASGGQDALMVLFQKDGKAFGFGGWDAQMPLSQQNKSVHELLAGGYRGNFIRFTRGSVLKDGNTMEHMASFNYAYKLQAVRDWLFAQEKRK